MSGDEWIARPQTQAGIWHALKACALAIASACEDCAGDVTVEWRARSADWVVTVEHHETCPHLRGITGTNQEGLHP